MELWSILFKFIYELKQIFIWPLFNGESLDRLMESLRPIRVVPFISVRRPGGLLIP